MKQKWFSAGRIGAISDGVFAIAMTLLVLELKFPDLKGPVSREVFSEALLGQVPHFFSWIISFAILCRLWITQHALLEEEDRKSRGFTTVNFIFLGAISFVPFPTSLISEHSDQPLSVIIFSATIIVAGLALAGMWHSMEKDKLDAELRSDMNRRVKRLIIWMAVIAIVSCLFTIINPRFGVIVWIVFPFAGMTTSRKRGDIGQQS